MELPHGPGLSRAYVVLSSSNVAGSCKLKRFLTRRESWFFLLLGLVLCRKTYRNPLHDKDWWNQIPLCHFFFIMDALLRGENKGRNEWLVYLSLSNKPQGLFTRSFKQLPIVLAPMGQWQYAGNFSWFLKKKKKRMELNILTEKSIRSINRLSTVLQIIRNLKQTIRTVTAILFWVIN